MLLCLLFLKKYCRYIVYPEILQVMKPKIARARLFASLQSFYYYFASNNCLPQFGLPVEEFEVLNSAVAF